jgi:peptidyl-prolyl cis-trans isomerase C
MSRANGMRALILVTAIGLSACDNHKKVSSKVLVRVNGDAITARQLEAELWNASPASDDGAARRHMVRRQALEALIDRQVLLDEAVRNKIDRDPKVMQIVERFKTQAIAQAYLESRAANLTPPSKAEIADYYRSHPELFAYRKVFDTTQLTIAAQDFNRPVKLEMDAARSLDEVMLWLQQHKIDFVKTQRSYTSAELPPDIARKLQGLGRNRLFVMKDGQRDLLCALTDLRDSPVSAEAAAGQIERYLFNKKMQEAAKAEIARLRSRAKLDYVDKSVTTAVDGELQASAAAPDN